MQCILNIPFFLLRLTINFMAKHIIAIFHIQCMSLYLKYSFWVVVFYSQPVKNVCRYAHLKACHDFRIKYRPYVITVKSYETC